MRSNLALCSARTSTPVPRYPTTPMPIFHATIPPIAHDAKQPGSARPELPYLQLTALHPRSPSPRDQSPPPHFMRSNLVGLGQNFCTSNSPCYILDPHAPNLPLPILCEATWQCTRPELPFPHPPRYSPRPPLPNTTPPPPPLPPPPNHTLHAKQPGKCARPELPYPHLVMLLPRSPSSHSPPLSEATWHAFTARTSVQDSASPVIVLALLPHFPHTPAPPCQYSQPFPPPLRRALSPTRSRPLVFQYVGPAGSGESHTDRPFPSAPSSHGTTTEALLLPHPAASPVTPPRQRARPTVAATTTLPVRRALSIIPPLVTEPATGRPDTVTVTGLRRTTSRGSIR